MRFEIVDVDGIRWAGSPREERAMRIGEEGVVGDGLDGASVWVNSTRLEVGKAMIRVVGIAEERAEAQGLLNSGDGAGRRRRQRREAGDRRRGGCKVRHTER